MKALRSSVSAIARRSSGLSNGGSSRLISKCGADVAGRQLADRLRHLRSHVVVSGHLTGKREGHVELAGDEGQDRVEGSWMIVYSMPSR